MPRIPKQNDSVNELATQIMERLSKRNIHTEMESSTILRISDYTFELSTKKYSVTMIGQHYIIPVSYGVDVLTDMILMVVTRSESKQIEIAAVNFVRKMGVPANLKGYHLLVIAICLAVYNTEYICNTEMLYTDIAKRGNISKCGVERCIRKAIEKAYDNSPDQIQDMFYYKITKPYCSEVISLAADSIRREYFSEEINRK